MSIYCSFHLQQPFVPTIAFQSVAHVLRINRTYIKIIGLVHVDRRIGLKKYNVPERHLLPLFALWWLSLNVCWSCATADPPYTTRGIECRIDDHWIHRYRETKMPQKWATVLDLTHRSPQSSLVNKAQKEILIPWPISGYSDRFSKIEANIFDWSHVWRLLIL